MKALVRDLSAKPLDLKSIGIRLKAMEDIQKAISKHPARQEWFRNVLIRNALIKCFYSGDIVICLTAMKTICSLVEGNKTNQVFFNHPPLPKALTDYLRNARPEVRSAAMETICELVSENPANQECFTKDTVLNALIDCLEDEENYYVRANAAKAIYKLMKQNLPFITKIEKPPLLNQLRDALINCLQDKYFTACMCAARVILQFIVEKPDQTLFKKRIVRNALTLCLRDPDPRVRVTALSSTCSYVHEKPAYQEFFGAYSQLRTAITHCTLDDNPIVRINTATAIFELAQKAPSNQKRFGTVKIRDALISSLQTVDKILCAHALRAIYALVNRSIANKKLFSEDELKFRLIQCLKMNDLYICINAAVIIQVLVSEHPDNQRLFKTYEMRNTLIACLQNTDPLIVAKTTDAIYALVKNNHSNQAFFGTEDLKTQLSRSIRVLKGEADTRARGTLAYLSNPHDEAESSTFRVSRTPRNPFTVGQLDKASSKVAHSGSGFNP